MDLIILAEGLYHLVPVTKSMLVGIEIPKSPDCFDLCEIIRETYTTYIESKNVHAINGHKGQFFYGCICGAEAPQ
jgi:hypothetical protein